MIRSITAAIIAGVLLSSAPALAASDPVEGLWLTQNKRSVIEVAPCESGVCGYVHWVIEGGMQFDEKNPDETKRGKPICGLPILWGFEQEKSGVWEDGHIYKADDGDVYHANMEIQEDGTLRVRGYVGVPMFGKTQIWSRVMDESLYPKCTVQK